MAQLIMEVKADGDTIGGVIGCVVKGCPVGLGEPAFGKLHAALGSAMLSINAVKGFEYGMGFAGVCQRGSEQNDIFVPDGHGGITTRTNRSGGIQGGIADNCLVAENYTFGENNANGGGMDVASATNCTVACNTSYKRVAGLVANVAYNCLVVGNIQTNSQSVAVVSDWEDDVSVRAKYRYTCTSSRTGEGYVVSDFASAGFVDAANADYHLTKDSPAFKIGSRLSYTADSVDLDGQPRIFFFNRRKARPDAGCYELPHTKLPGFQLILR